MTLVILTEGVRRNRYACSYLYINLLYQFWNISKRLPLEGAVERSETEGVLKHRFTLFLILLIITLTMLRIIRSGGADFYVLITCFFSP